MILDKEMQDEFVKEVKALQKELRLITENLTKNWKQPALFAEFGQKVDRIYGTAATLGFTDFANYAKAMKDMCYMCSHSVNEIAQKKVLGMMLTCLENFDTLCAGVYDKKILASVSNQVKISMQKVSVLEKSVLADCKDKKSIKAA